VSKLLTAFKRLIDAGGSLVVIEHNLDVIKSADWVIDLGPEAGAGGGQVVAAGTPEQVSQTPGSHTGHGSRLLWRRKRRGQRNEAAILPSGRGVIAGPCHPVRAQAQNQLPPGTRAPDSVSQPQHPPQREEAENKIDQKDFEGARPCW